MVVKQIVIAIVFHSILFLGVFVLEIVFGRLVGCKLDTLANGRSSDIMSLKKCEVVTCIYLRNYSEFDLKKFHCHFFLIDPAYNEIIHFEK